MVQAGREPEGAAAEATPASKPYKGAPATPADFHLSLATALLEQGNDAEAAAHLERYVTQRPEHLAARAQLGELLFRQGKLEDSRVQLEMFIAMAQEHGEAASRYLVHCHSRLVEIASAQKDQYEEHLNRGIGLYLLACRRGKEPDPDGEFSVGSLLCRSAMELQHAREDDDEQARPHFYLSQVWTRLGQPGAARRALAAADGSACLTRLTPAERRELHAMRLEEMSLSLVSTTAR